MSFGRETLTALYSHIQNVKTCNYSTNTRSDIMQALRLVLEEYVSAGANVIEVRPLRLTFPFIPNDRCQVTGVITQSLQLPFIDRQHMGEHV